jgi:hypothetical protein
LYFIAVLLEQRQELLLKGHLPVVLRLALEIVNALVQPSLICFPKLFTTEGSAPAKTPARGW